MPDDVRAEFGFALYQLQTGVTPIGLRAFGEGLDHRILKLSSDGIDRNTYRLALTVSLPDTIYVLDAFVKKSRRGISTPTGEKQRVLQRFRTACDHYRTMYRERP